MSVVRCPFCDRRYNVAGIPTGTKVLCVSCRATLTVPPMRRGARHASWRRWVSESPVTQVAAGLVGGLLIATVAYLVLRPRAVPSVSMAVALEPSTEDHPVARRDGGERSLNFRGLSRDEQVDLFTQSICREFGSTWALFHHQPPSPFILAGERQDFMKLQGMFEDFEKALESLVQTFEAEFGRPLGMGAIDELLPIVIFTSRSTFDAYQRGGGNVPLPPEVPGIYEYSNRRVVFLYTREGYPIEVLLHEAMHQMIHYYFRQRAESERRQSWWFQEGMATYFEQFDRNPFPVAVPSRTSPRASMLKESIRRGETQPLFGLMGMEINDIWDHWSKSPASPEEHDQRMRFTQLCYGEAWAVVHYLRHGAGGKYRRLFDEYFMKELEGMGNKDEFVRLLSNRFGMELAQLQHEVEEYVLSLP